VRTTVKEAYDEGVGAALTRFGLKEAAEEIRLKIPKREFHGFDAAFKARVKAPKQANTEPLEAQASPDQPAEMLADLLQSLPTPRLPNDAKSNTLDRPVTWGSPSDVSKGAV
jgi:hypothetical protein